MITENFRQLDRIALQSHANGSGMVHVTNINGLISYAAPTFAFPMAVPTLTVALNTSAAGISFGTDDTEATPYDLNLGSTITSGINTLITKQETGVDTDGVGSPYIKTWITVTNTSSDVLVIKEIGYKQTISTAPYVGSTARSNQVCLIDRTVLDEPLELAAGDAGVIVYKILTALPEAQTISNVKIVPWEFGSDEDITAMIQAAHEGKIDLQADAGWRIGMKRPITISAFTGGGDVQHAEQVIDLVITSFDDYENCGCVMQIDFDEALATGQRMNASATNVGGYGGSEMYTTTIPALVEALPEYIQDMLISFTVKASAGNKSSEIVETPNNKLALRSVLELKGTNTNSYAGEGDGRTPYYALYNGTKRKGRTVEKAYNLWTRSPYSGSSNYFCEMDENGRVPANGYNANYAYAWAPFGCI